MSGRKGTNGSFGLNAAQRVVRHARITLKGAKQTNPPMPSFLILFINSICNLKCEHCFYWRNLNRPDDLTVDELRALSQELGRIENLNLSGGEPFIRPEFAQICSFFIRNNKVREIYVPTSGFFTERMERQIREVLAEPSLRLLAIELSLDGMPEFHNRFRGHPESFERAMASYQMLEALQQTDARLRIHSISTVTADNVDEIRNLSAYLHHHCPAIDHHNLALIRGDRKNPSLTGPDLQAYEALWSDMRLLWSDRERGRYGGLVEPMLQWAKCRTAKSQTQVVPCLAGRLSAVVYSNGDVSVCETHPPLGNLRERSFREIWHSVEANDLRRSIRAKECYCTNEVFLWPSISFQPLQLARAAVRGRSSGRSTAPAAVPDGRR